MSAPMQPASKRPTCKGCRQAGCFLCWYSVRNASPRPDWLAQPPAGGRPGCASALRSHLTGCHCLGGSSSSSTLASTSEEGVEARTAPAAVCMRSPVMPTMCPAGAPPPPSPCWSAACTAVSSAAATTGWETRGARFINRAIARVAGHSGRVRTLALLSSAAADSCALPVAARAAFTQQLAQPPLVEAVEGASRGSYPLYVLFPGPGKWPVRSAPQIALSI